MKLGHRTRFRRKTAAEGVSSFLRLGCHNGNIGVGRIPAYATGENLMALIIDLKPNERVIIGNALITNGEHRARLQIAGDSPILREKDIMREEEANSPCKRIYFIIQGMYLSKDPKVLHESYLSEMRDVKNAAPSTAPFFKKINLQLLSGNYYKALKETHHLVEYETGLLSNV
jgi:flagellar protein FlbT